MAIMNYICAKDLEMLDVISITSEVETPEILRKVAVAHRRLAELKGVITSIPNESILIEALTLSEARESSAIENIITTFDEVYQNSLFNRHFSSPEAKEVHQYADALKTGFALVQENGLLTTNHILKIQAVLEDNDAGFRKLPGTSLKNDRTGEVVYTPPQNFQDIIILMNDLEKFINDDLQSNIDPLIKMAIIHHQFESIHPFYDGNGRTGRILNILYLVQKGILDLPVLYLSRFIITHKLEYYRLLQAVRETGKWEDWILYILDGLASTAEEAVKLVRDIKELMLTYKHAIRNRYPKMYSQDLINNLFKYPYTKIEFIERDLDVSRSTAIRYLTNLVSEGILIKIKVGRENFYLNARLFGLLKRD